MDIPISSRIHISGNLVYLYGHEGFYQESVAIDKNERIPCPFKDRIAEGLDLSCSQPANDAVPPADIDDGGVSFIGDLGRAMVAGEIFDGGCLMWDAGVDEDDSGFDCFGQHFLRGLVLAGHGFAFAGDGLGAAGGGKEILTVIEDNEEPVIEVRVQGFAVDGAIFGQLRIGNGEQGGEIFQAVSGALDTDLGNDGVFIMPADEYFPRTTGRGGEPGKSVLCL